MNQAPEEKLDIKSLLLPELEKQICRMGEKKFRAKQIYGWLHQQKAVSFAEMGNLPLSLREKLEETCRIPSLKTAARQISALDGTRKYAFALEDGLPRVHPHKEHQHTDIKVILVADHFDAETRKLVQKKSFSKSYHFSLWGFSNLLTAAVDLGEGKAYPNKVGHDLEKFFRKLFDLRKEEG